MKVCVNSLILLAVVLYLNAWPILAQNVTSTIYNNGCVLEHSTEDGTSGSVRPFLNCSGLGKTSFDMSSFPANIKSISLSHNQLEHFDLEKIAGFSSLSKLDLSYNAISDLAPASSGITFEFLSTVNLKNNTFKAWPSEAFGTFSKVTVLDISNNQISSIGDEDFTNLEKLQMLRMGGNPITVISPTALQNLKTTLYGVTMQFCGLTEIPRLFVNMTSLIYVSLIGNKISYIPRYAFSGDTSLRWLEIASNRIRSIDRFAFAGAERLHLLDLSDNQIATLPYGVFDVLSNKDHPSVELYQNPINCNCSMRWFKNWIESLQYRDIRFKCEQPARNHGKSWYELDSSDFSCNKNDMRWKEDCSHVLEQINKLRPTKKSAESTSCPNKCKCYNSTGQQYFPKEEEGKRLKRSWWFPVEYPYVDCSNIGLSRLPLNIRNDVKTLNFINNNIQSVRIRDLRRYPLMSIIYLESVGLKTIMSDASTVLRNLRYVSLQHNNITSITRQQLKSFPNLKLLRISNNKIQRFKNDMFAENRLLKRLYLGPNPATNFETSMISHLRDLVTLSLRNLSLTTIPTMIFRNLTYLELSDNFITAIQNNTFVNTPNVVKIGFDNNRITYIGSLAFNNTNQLVKLDLSENMIEKLPPGVFYPLDQDGLQIELWMNPISCDCQMRWFKLWIEQLEEEDPTTDIRFLCKLPWRTYGKTSDELSYKQFTCQANDRKTDPSQDHFDIIDEYYTYKYGTCHSNGQMALAVLLTMIFTSLFLGLMKWCFNRRRHKYRKPGSDLAPLSMDEQ